MILLAAGAAFAYIIARNKKAAAENLRFEPVDIAIDSERSRASLFTRLYYKVKLRLINDEQGSIKVNTVLLNAFVNNKAFGTLTSSQNFTVPAQGSQVVQLDTSISTFGAAATIVEVLRNQQPLTINVQGYIETDLGRVTVNFSKVVSL